MTQLLKKLGKDAEADVKHAKEHGCAVQLLPLGDKTFVYRSLNRLEWKALQAESLNKTKGIDGTVDPMKVIEIKDESEDSVVMKALIYPKHETVAELASYPAGYISQLADRITELSGFGEAAVEPTDL
jgi:hypothetical protein